MFVVLDRHWIQSLAELPESGMGYQTVNIRLRSGLQVEGLHVYNSAHLDWPDDRPKINSTDIAEIVPPQQLRRDLQDIRVVASKNRRFANLVSVVTGSLPTHSVNTEDP